MIENMFDWHLIVPDVCPVEEEFLFVLLLFWICFFQFVFVCLFICVCLCVFICMRFPQTVLTHPSTRLCFDIRGTETSLFIYCVGGDKVLMCVSVCVLCISGKMDDLEKKDFSLIIGYFNSNFHI